ncbi:hypothetical protein [Caldicellulosiruptor acetigenus]|uniref:hypothetical protein n=1 Tax=Caldicellulosiruptor acetigenus TaxID=301953 RepID=UPI0002DA8405|nr:hypothetical protein [Caldicellulosiruptor acetigenus]
MIFAFLNFLDYYNLKNKKLNKVKLKTKSEIRTKIENLIKKYSTSAQPLFLWLLFLAGGLSTISILSCSGGIIISFVLKQSNVDISSLLFS